MLILGLLGMYFDAAVVFVTSQTLLFRLALAILCAVTFGFPNSKKNSFRGNYMRKYGSYFEPNWALFNFFWNYSPFIIKTLF